MGTQVANLVVELRGQKSLLDLDTFEQVTLVKTKDFVPVGTAQEALSRLGNDSNKLIEAVNEGLRVIERRDMIADNSIPWQEIDEDTKKIVGPFSGTPADSGKVNALVLSMAKSMFGYDGATSAEQKRAAKDAAISAIRSNPMFLEQLKKNAAANLAETE